MREEAVVVPIEKRREAGVAFAPRWRRPRPDPAGAGLPGSGDGSPDAGALPPGGEANLARDVLGAKGGSPLRDLPERDHLEKASREGRRPHPARPNRSA